jgi:hypothetical protein
MDDVAFCVRYRPAMRRFEVTKERLGVYLPTEHIDNPKDYADNEDARKYDPRLRGPVDPRELEVDPRTGMKNCEYRRPGWGLRQADRSLIWFVSFSPHRYRQW